MQSQAGCLEGNKLSMHGRSKNIITIINGCKFILFHIIWLHIHYTSENLSLVSLYIEIEFYKCEFCVNRGLSHELHLSVYALLTGIMLMIAPWFNIYVYICVLFLHGIWLGCLITGKFQHKPDI